jgi:hypothetical protein
MNILAFDVQRHLSFLFQLIHGKDDMGAGDMVKMARPPDPASG